jgi:hypothetical protein
LAAIVGALRELGWPVESVDISAPTFENPNRNIARYRLPDDVIQMARDIAAGVA